MKRRLTFNITLVSAVGARQCSIDELNTSLAKFLQAATAGTDETVELSMYASTKNGD